MPTRYTVICDDESAREIEQLARQHDLPEGEVLQQLIDLGLDSIERDPHSISRF
jgi:predicted transcriptional regulator